MFYAHFVLAKKGPLARIWLAAHWDKKLTKAHVFETNIEKSVEGILQPKVKMALRTSGHLLLGVVRIYSRKAKYLLADCNEAFVKIKMAFRPGVVDLPETNREAAVNAITLPEVFHNFDTAVPDSQETLLDTSELLHHQTRAEEITMREDYGTLHMDAATAGGGAFMTDLLMPSSLGELTEEEDESAKAIGGSLFDDEDDAGIHKINNNENSITLSEAPHPIQDDDDDPHDILFNDEGQQRGGLYDDEDEEDDAFDDGSHLRDLPADHPPSPLMSSREPSPAPSLEADKSAQAAGGPSGASPPPPEVSDLPTPSPKVPEPPKEVSLPVADQTTLIRDEEESFALAPVDASAIRGTVRTKRKRKLIVDEVKAIAGEEMKAQLSDTADIVTTLDLAPPTKRLMHWKETGGVEKLFALPGRPLHDTAIFKFYQTCLTARPSENEAFGLLGDSENILLDNVPGGPPVRPESPYEPAPTPRRAPRKRKTWSEESPSKRAQREEDEAAAAAQAEAYRREQQAMMNNSDMYDTSHLLQKQREEEEAAAAAAGGQEAWSQPPEQEGGKEPGEPINVSDTQVASSDVPSAPDASFQSNNTTSEQPIPSSETPFDNLGFNGGGASDANMSWDAMNGGGVEPPSPGAHSMGAPSPHHDASDDDFGGPMSVEENPEEEMGEEETIEEFEDRVLNKRALQLSNILKDKFESNDTVVFNNVCRGNTRKQAAQKFYSMLVLQKMMAVEVSQPGSFGDISISKGPKFDTAVF